MRIYSVDTLSGDHLYYTVANTSYEAMGNHGPNVTVVDIGECLSDKEIEEVVDNDLDEDEETLNELRKEYGL